MEKQLNGDMKTTKDKVLKYYDKYLSGEVSLMEVAVSAKTNRHYASQIIGLHTMQLNVDKKYTKNPYDFTDAPKKYNPEDEIKHIEVIYHPKEIELKIKSKL